MYTEYWPALNKMTIPEPGDVEDLILLLQDKLIEKRDNPPDAPTLRDVPLQ